jgi:diacylglycerol kinase family enzyme
MTLHELHAILQAAFDSMATVHGNVPNGTGNDTAIAVGYALGSLSKAKALVGRDIDDAIAKTRPPS